MNRFWGTLPSEWRAQLTSVYAELDMEAAGSFDSSTLAYNSQGSSVKAEHVALVARLQAGTDTSYADRIEVGTTPAGTGWWDSWRHCAQWDGIDCPTKFAT